MSNCHIYIKSKKWVEQDDFHLYGGLRNFTREVINQSVKCLKINCNLRMAISFTDAEEIMFLNQKYRNKDKSTDVLSFASIDNYNLLKEYILQKYKNIDNLDIFIYPDYLIKNSQFLGLGDIVLSYYNVLTDAQRDGVNFIEHTRKLIIHGFLHLLGFDHELEDDFEIMQKIEDIINSSFD